MKIIPSIVIEQIEIVSSSYTKVAYRKMFRLHTIHIIQKFIIWKDDDESYFDTKQKFFHTLKQSFVFSLLPLEPALEYVGRLR